MTIKVMVVMLDGMEEIEGVIVEMVETMVWVWVMVERNGYE